MEFLAFMSFQEKQARYKHLIKEHAAWGLLRADNSPHVLAFVADLFLDSAEISFGQAKAALEAELKQSFNNGAWATETSAVAYLRQWIKSGWLRELNDMLSKTSACETALRFCHSLDHNDTSVTASHLKIVQDAVRDLATAINPNPDERIAILESRKRAIQFEIDELNAGIIKQMSNRAINENLREIYQLASVLTGDFRRVEDEIRQLDQELRIQMIEQGASRGDVLSNLIKKEQLLSETDAGQAFEGFFSLVMNENLSRELREQMRTILNQPEASELSKEQYRFLSRLMRELSRESERVFQIRRRTEESLRGFIDSGAHLENQTINQLLHELEQIAVNFKDSDINFKTPLKINLNTGNVKIKSPDSLRLRIPDDKIDTSNITVEKNTKNPSLDILNHLNSVRIKQVAEQMKHCLSKHGPMTIAAIVRKRPVRSGLEELVAQIRVAKSVRATELPDKEEVFILDHNGYKLKALIPKLLLSADQFPDNIEELVL